MIVLLFSILVAALGLAFLQLKYTMSHGPTTTALLERNALRSERSSVASAKARQNQDALLERNALAPVHQEDLQEAQAPRFNHNVYSARMLQEDAAPHPHGMPSTLGLSLKEKSPNECYFQYEESANFEVGAIYPFLECGVIGHPDQIATYIIVRVNTPHRWLRLVVTRYKEESLEETVMTYLETLSLFDGKTPFFV